MGKNLAITSGAKHLVGKKMYLTDSNLVHREVKKAYLTVGGVHRLCYKADTMTISYTGDMIDAGIVTMTDGEYRLLTLTSSGTLTVETAVSAEVWMCSGGSNGYAGAAAEYGGGGGAGAYTATGSVTLSGSMAATVGAGGGGISSFGKVSSRQGVNNSRTTSGYNGSYGGTGGGAGGGMGTYGSGDGVSKYPFLDAAYFANPHCGGGGGGGFIPSASLKYRGGNGGTNGGAGGPAYSGVQSGGAGGSYGGGNGGTATTYKNNATMGDSATYYGSGGGGGGAHSTSGRYGGNGYQGVIYIRIPVNQ